MRPIWLVPKQYSALFCRQQILHSRNRHASLTSAIEHGKRKSNAAIDRGYDRDIEGSRVGERKEVELGQKFQKHVLEAGDITSKGPREVPRSRFRIGNDKPHSSRRPMSIPYTTPASQFLYGRFAVIAALKARRRKLYKLYILQGEGTKDRTEDVERLARTRRLRVQYVDSDWENTLSKMSEGRPHNGVVLEASPLPRLPIRALEESKSASDHIRVRLDSMSEEEREIAGGSSVVPRKVLTDRYPFVLLLDRILDPGNLGAIIRSAYFLGVDALIMSRSGSAPISAVTVKASAGAAEALPLLTANAPVDFLKKSKESGWQIFAAVSPSSESGHMRKEKFVQPGSALANGPCVLVIGGEGEGIARSIMRETSGYVGIPQVHRDDGLDIVESLNVSVATALMVQQFVHSSMGTSESADSHNMDTKLDGVGRPEKLF